MNEKKPLVVILVLFVAFLMGCTSVTNNESVNSLLSGEKYLGVVTEYDNSIGKDMTYFVFIAGDTKNAEWNRKIVGDNDFCKDGYLYSKNIRTGEIIQLLTVPVVYQFQESVKSRVVYAVTMGQIIKTTVMAEYLESLCDMDENVIRIESSSKGLYVVTDDNIYLVSKENGSKTVLLKNDIYCYSALPVSPDKVALFCYDGKEDSYYLYDSKTGSTIKASESDINSYILHDVKIGP